MDVCKDSTSLLSTTGSLNRPKTPVSDGAIVIQIRQFFDEWHIRFASSSLGKSWTRGKCVKAALDLLVLNGMLMKPDEVAACTSMEEERMVQEVALALPGELRANFDSLAKSLMVLVSTAMRLRSAAEHGQEKVAEVVEEVENDVMAQQIMKRGVAAASTEVGRLRECTKSWSSNMENRMERMAKASDSAAGAQQRLLAVQRQLETFHGSAKAKTSKMLLNFVSADTTAMMQATFSGWYSHTLKAKSEKHIRDRYEKEAEDAERQLMEYKMKQLDNARNVLVRNADSNSMGFLGMVLSNWAQEVVDAKAAREAAAQQDEIEGKLKAVSQAQMEGAKKVMSRVGGDQDAVVRSLAMQAWLKYSEEYKKEKDVEESLKDVEAKMKEMMAKNKANASSVMDRLNAATATGLIELAFTGWQDMLRESKSAREIENAMKANSDKFKSLKLRQGSAAAGAATKATDQQNQLLLTRVVCVWHMWARVNRMEKYYNNKIDTKRKQLQSVQGLFAGFAQQLEQGLVLDTARGQETGRPGSRSGSRAGSSRAGSQTLKGKGGGSMSLPNIHQKDYHYNKGIRA